MTELKIVAFEGINNVDPAEKARPAEVQKAKNVKCTSTGELMMRDGYIKVYSGSPHSPFCANEIALFREDADLKRFTGLSASILKTGILGDRRMHYFSLNGLIYFSDEVITGITDGITVKDWGITVPQPPIMTETAGNLIPGRYICAVTHMRDDLEESGASTPQQIDITQGGIQFTNLPVSADPYVRYTVVYMTTSGGEVLYRALILANGTQSAAYTGTGLEFKTKLTTAFLSPPPAGHIIQFFKGKIYVAKDNVLWHTEPYRYGLVDLAHNFHVFDSRLSVVAPVTDGIWIATQTTTQFLSMQNGEFFPITKADHGATENSQQITTELGKGGETVRLWVWASGDGICYGGDQGLFRNLSEDKYTIPGTPTIGASVIQEEDEGSFYIVNLI